MPKKRLTKAQVKRKVKTMHNAMYDLFIDKIGHGGESFAKISIAKANDLLSNIKRMQIK
jgi:hypothetical protein